MRTKRIIGWSLIFVALAAVAYFAITRSRTWNAIHLTLQGAVIRKASDPRNQLPIEGTTITAIHDQTTVTAQSDASGYFRITFPELIWPGQSVSLNFRHDGYKTQDRLTQIQFRSTGKRLLVVALEPDAESASEPHPDGRPASVIANIRVRYTENLESDQNIGSAVKTFQVENHANIPCRHQAPCSPDGSWKASTGSATLDAGPGNEFRNIRVSCIAGPCPFTRIDSSGFEHAGRVITASATDWSDTATFLFEAEVYHTAISSSVRYSYPVIFGRTLNFTLPPTQEGLSIDADLDGARMVFPMSPDLELSWATCGARTSADNEKSTVYLCELKPGYRF
ncbi:MAG TPA: carboxypeptidase-like regulatory domain-containing protein [Terracidiphilus sp.]|jgi:hypothetical protein|nr:carboxypeptidase-like regulatory domain-containing protein [Terracidiphilus sp.]